MLLWKLQGASILLVRGNSFVLFSEERYWLFLEILELKGNLDLVQFFILQMGTLRSREMMRLSCSSKAEDWCGWERTPAFWFLPEHK